MRSNKVGSALELVVMGSVSKTLRKLPQESRVRVVNWLSAQSWEDEEPSAAKTTVKASTETLAPALS